MSNKDYLGNPIDVDLLVDMKYLSNADRNQVKTASFSRVADYSTLEPGDLILMFQTQEDHDAIKAKWPWMYFGPTWTGILDARSYLPILVEINRVHREFDGPRGFSVTFKERFGCRALDYQQVWRYIG